MEDFILPDHTPVSGMTNEQWAQSLLSKMKDLHDETMKIMFLDKALEYACIYSERPSDRFSKAHVFKGHRIQAWRDRPGYVTVLCEECNDGVDVEINANAALVLLLMERGVLPMDLKQEGNIHA